MPNADGFAWALHRGLDLYADRALWRKLMLNGMTDKSVEEMVEVVKSWSSPAELLPGEDIAAIISVSVETVSRIIADMKRRRLLTKVASHLYRCDTEALETITRQAAE